MPMAVITNRSQHFCSSWLIETPCGRSLGLPNLRWTPSSEHQMILGEVLSELWAGSYLDGLGWHIHGISLAGLGDGIGRTRGKSLDPDSITGSLWRPRGGRYDWHISRSEAGQNPLFGHQICPLCDASKPALDPLVADVGKVYPGLGICVGQCSRGI